MLQTIISRMSQVTVFEEADESSALQQRYIVLYAKYVCDMNNFLQIYI